FLQLFSTIVGYGCTSFFGRTSFLGALTRGPWSWPQSTRPYLTTPIRSSSRWAADGRSAERSRDQRLRPRTVEPHSVEPSLPATSATEQKYCTIRGRCAAGYAF
ncbi:MAG TPA: hypothetical protein VE197_15305, partial [Mycobacterium sp.]|nr:hypothetical protein [Mycobacterium sp.]